MGRIIYGINTIEAIKESLDIWIDRLLGKPRNNSCPLCMIFRKDDFKQSCNGCPIYEKTGLRECKGTSYYETGEKRNLGMVKLLASLLPDYEPDSKPKEKEFRINNPFESFDKKFTQDGIPFDSFGSQGNYSPMDMVRKFEEGRGIGRNEIAKVKQDELDAAYANGKRVQGLYREKEVEDLKEALNSEIKFRRNELNFVFDNGKREGIITGKKVVANEIGRLSNIILSKYGGKI